VSLLALVVAVPAIVAFVVLPIVVYLWGRGLSERHEATASAHVRAKPDDVMALLTDVRAIPKWRKTVRRVDVVAKEPVLRFREHGAQGTLELEVAERDAPHRLVIRTAPARRMAFEGTWTYALAPEDDGTRVTLTEHGTVRSPIARVFSTYVLGHRTHVERTIAALVQRFGR